MADFQSRGRTIYFTHFQQASHARLDRIYCSLELMNELNSYGVEPVYFTDHCIVAITIGQTSRKPKRINWKLWKLNSQQLKDETFTTDTRQLLKQVASQTQHVSAAWKRFKEELKQLAIKRSTIISYHKHREEKKLLNDLRLLHELECINQGQGAKDISYVKAQLESLYQERYQGAVVRSRAERYLIGEQPTKKSNGRRTRHAVTKEILEIEHNNKIVTDKLEIQHVFVEHYRSLFGKNEDIKDAKCLIKLISLLPRLDERQIKDLEDPMSLAEIENAVDGLPDGKTPDPDGIISEFYKMPKNVICPILQVLFREAYQSNALPPPFYVLTQF